MPPEADRILLDHGSGGLLSARLVEEIVVPALGSAHLGSLEDSTVLEVGTKHIAMTTDSFVVDPIFFGGGDIGKIAVCGTVNDLAVAGATPKYLTLSLVLEEGFPLEDLRRIVASVRDAAEEAGVAIVGGDTKVVGRGELDKIVINTTGVGLVDESRPRISVKRIRVGDRVLVSGPVGNHGVHILSMREGLGFESRVKSDCAPLAGMIAGVLAEAGDGVRCMKDLTRGGLGGILTEIAAAAGVSLRVREESLPIEPATAMACDMLGVSPLYLANEGCIALFVAEEVADRVLARLRSHPYGRNAVAIGAVVDAAPPRVLREREGRVVGEIEPLLGRVLPRLC
jgi:hydrogenase expression/formation protein HypE